VAVVAATFHFRPADIWEMDLDDLGYWVKQANWINTR